VTVTNDSETSSGLNDRVVTDVLRLAPMADPGRPRLHSRTQAIPGLMPGRVHWSSIARRLVNACGLFLWTRRLTTSPAATFIAAMIETVPRRRHSNSRRASRPSRAGISGRIRVFAWMPVFSSMLTRTVPGGGSRHRRQTGERSDQPDRLVEGQRVLGWREPLGELDIASSGKLR
jgi:hypothetical protein